MRRLRMVAIAGVLVMGTGACAPTLSGFGFGVRPGCPVYQARAYKTTSIMATKQRVQQIQARYSMTRGYTSVGTTSNALVSGECR